MADRQGTPFLVWGVTGETLHLMPTRGGTRVSGSIPCAGRVKLTASDVSDVIFVDTVPRVHRHVSTLYCIGAVHDSVVFDIETEIARQHVEWAARQEGQRFGAASFKQVPLSSINDNAPTAEQRRLFAIADAAR